MSEQECVSRKMVVNECEAETVLKMNGNVWDRERERERVNGG